ncbi:MAG: adenylyltransferase/cytidyltransferase family protein [Alphaproteobacteria bacterium]|jgi:FAD synthetase|nr:adenylyltransferase/cytidyltransferase family protein [Alphaproteobacteria bacterium]
MIVLYESGTHLFLPKSGRVLVGGCFDLLHYGHIRFLEEARLKGQSLTIALEPDEMIIKSKKRHPVHTQEQRAAILTALRPVDCVLLLPLLVSFEDYYALVRDVSPSVIAVTQGDPQIENKRRQVALSGGQVEVVVPQLEGFSSSHILSLLGEHL